jgi:fructokinase
MTCPVSSNLAVVYCGANFGAPVTASSGTLLRAICIGEVLWDVFGDQEHLGGAPFNFAAHLKKLGHQVEFVSAIGNDILGQRVLDRMREIGLSTRYLHRDPAHATGTATVKINAAGQPQFTIHRPSAYDFPQLSEADFSHLFAEAVDWIYFGTLHQMSPAAKNLTSRLLDSSGAAHKFYDLNLRQNSYDAGLIRELMARASIMKMNDEEVVTIAKLFGYAYESLEKFCRDYTQKFGWEAVCVTRGSKGCSLLIGGQFVEMPGYAIQVADAVGAGDAFAAGFVHGFSNHWPPAQVADFANRVGALIASRHGAIPQWTLAEVEALNRQSQQQESA